MFAKRRSPFNTFNWVLLCAFALSFSISNAAPPPKTTAKKPARAASAVPAKPVVRKPVVQGPVRIDKIVIKGNKKIETDAVLAKVVSKVGDDLDLNAIRRDVQEVFKLGYFYDVIIEKDPSPEGGVILTYEVVEKPQVAEIVYEGNTEFKDEELQEATGIKAFEILNMAKIREAIAKVEKNYEDKGFFLARVDFTTEPMPKGDGVKLIFRIRENDKVQVKRIIFLGNNKVTSTRLKSAMITKENSLFSFISGSGAYKQEAFDHDIQMLNFLYFNEGYVQIKVDRPQVYVTPDKKSIVITIRVEEGEQFNVGQIDYTGDLLFTKSELEEATTLKEGQLFVYETLQKDIQSLTAKYGDLGYAFANVIPRTQVRDKDRVVDITFEFDKGNKVYIGKINVIGNSKTRDKVVRRELKIREGELYNETRKRESMALVKRLGFFEEVNFNQKVDRDDPTKVDIDIVVKERNTGTLQIGAGYSSFFGVIFNGQISQTNLMGRGQNLSASVDFSKVQSLFRLSFTEPYFMDTRWSLGFDLYQSRRFLIDYSELKTGGAVRVGHPLAPYLDGFIRYKLDKTDLRLENDGDPDLFPVSTANGITSSVTFSLEYDRRNDRFAPTKGIYSRTDLEYAGLGGEQKYTKGFATARYYKEMFWKLVWRNNLSYAFIRSNVAGREPPFNELFLLGGANSLRGFDWFTIGRKRRSQKAIDRAIQNGATQEQADIVGQRPFGGMQQLFYNMEVQFPLIEEANIQGVLFYDIGQAEDTIDFSDFRSDVGFGFRWFSPIGPLRFEWGFPLDRKPQFGEQPVNFQFAIGAPF